MNNLMKKITTIVLAAVMLTGSAACAADEGILVPGATTQTGLQGKIVASGSTSMEDLMNALGETFHVINPSVTVEIQGGGSSTGIKNANDGVSDIGNSSRAIKPEEKSLGLKEYTIAIDGLAVVVNPGNSVASLTKAQVADIFTGKITNWNEVGGADAPVVVILREAGSGTRDGFESILDIADKCVGNQEVNETGIVKSTVAGNVNAIGYMSLGKVDDSIIAVTVDSVTPSEATVKDGSYILQRPFVCLTKGDESESVRAFFTFVFSNEGQAMVAQKGYVPVEG